MGNRANVIFTDGKESFSPTVYLHWNGGPESVYAFLNELDRRNIRADQCYEAARFVQLVGEFFDQEHIGGYSLGLMNGPKSASIEDLNKISTDNGDNGFYLINRTNRENSKTTVAGALHGWKSSHSSQSRDNKGRFSNLVPETCEAISERVIRRYRYNYSKETLEELHSTHVLNELKKALKSDYITKIAETFLKIQGTRKLESN
jgi:hypothetical protein